MSLNYGFGLYDGNNSAWVSLYNKLDEGDKAFAHQNLPWILMFTDIGIVTAESIPHIVARLALHSPDLSQEINGKLKEEGLTFADYLKRFIGFAANVHTTTSAEFIKKLKVPSLTAKNIAKVTKRPDVNTLLGEGA